MSAHLTKTKSHEVLRDGRQVTVSFGDGDTQLVYAVSMADDWIALRIAEIRGTRPTHVTLLAIRATITERGGDAEELSCHCRW